MLRVSCHPKSLTVFKADAQTTQHVWLYVDVGQAAGCRKTKKTTKVLNTTDAGIKPLRDHITAQANDESIESIKWNPIFLYTTFQRTEVMEDAKLTSTCSVAIMSKGPRRWNLWRIDDWKSRLKSGTNSSRSHRQSSLQNENFQPPDKNKSRWDADK